MTAVKSYRDLIAWQKAMSLVKAVYMETTHFPKVERYGLTSHIGTGKHCGRAGKKHYGRIQAVPRDRKGIIGRTRNLTDTFKKSGLS
jgi:23S rRNA-intervening sequence protein